MQNNVIGGLCNNLLITNYEIINNFVLYYSVHTCMAPGF